MKKYFVAVLLSFSGLTAAIAQEELSLSDAIRIGLDRNYDIQIGKRNTDIARNNNQWGEAGLMPSVTLSVSQNNNLTDNVKTATPFQLQDEVISHSLTPGIAVNWLLFNGLRVHISKDRLEKLQQESEQNAEIVVANTLQAIILTYFDAVLEKERLDEFAEQLKLSRDRYNYQKLKTDLGSAVSSDLLLEETNYLTDSTNYINQQMAYRDAFRSLNVLLAEGNVNKEYKLKDSLVFQDIDYRYEDLSAKLNRSNVDLRKQYILQSINKADVSLSKRDRIPSLSLQAGYNDSRSRVNLSRASIPTADGPVSGPSEPLSAITDTYYANLTLSYTLFNGRKINRAIRNAIVREDIGTMQLEKLKNSLNRDLLEALDEYNTRKLVLAISERRFTSASKNLQLNADKFKAGTISSFDYRTVQNSELAASIQRLQALYNLIDAHVTIMRLTGGIVESYIEK